MITKFDKATIRQLSAEIETSLRAIAERNGIEVKMGGGSYDPEVGMFRPKIEFSLASKAAAEWERWAEIYDLEAGDFGAEFESHGRRFRVAGVSPRSPKRPILCEEIIAGEPSGKQFKFPESSIRSALRHNGLAAPR